MRPIHRWSLVALAVALVVLVPMTVRALPVPDEPMSARDLLARVQGSEGAAYSGTVEVHGRLGLPVSDHFTDIADLLGSDTRMRVWWRDADAWRVDKLLPTGRDRPLPPRARDHPVGLRARRGADRRRPRDAAAPRRRPAPARAGATGADRGGRGDVSRLPARRIAGHDALGLRLRPSDPRTSVDHVDLWADADTGLVLALDAYGDAPQPALSTAFTSVDLSRPPARATSFHAASGVRRTVDDVLDIADAANQFAPVLPPDTVAGLPRAPSSQQAVGLYGGGLAQVLAVPLQEREACSLAEQLTHVRGPHGRRSAGAAGRTARRRPHLLPSAGGLRLGRRGHRHRRDPGAGRARSDAGSQVPRMIRTQGLTKRYGAVHAVEDVALDVAEGDVYGFLGAERLRQDHDRPDAARAGAAPPRARSR